MCDEITERDNDAYLLKQGGASRREALALMSAVGLAAMLPAPANAQEVMGKDVMVPTADGEADAYFVAPTEGKHPGVIVWTDIYGLRPAFKGMADRLAKSGYAVLTANPFYRDARAPILPEGATMADPGVREKLFGLATPLFSQPELTRTDAEAFIAYLDAQDSVDSAKQMGTTGYCMGGPLVLRTAAFFADRIGAGATFHGSRMVTDGDSSPHLLIPQADADFLVAIAENDDEQAPDHKTIMREAFEAADLNVEMEVYEGALHGWCPPDSRVYNEEAAEKAWARLLALFDGALV